MASGVPPDDNQRVLWLWRTNQIINALALVAVATAFVFLAVMFVRALVDPASDRHGYSMIFSAILGIVAIALLIPLAAGAINLRKRQRAGAAGQVVTGAIAAVVSAIVPGPFWIGILVGIGVAAPAVPLLLTKQSVDQ